MSSPGVKSTMTSRDLPVPVSASDEKTKEFMTYASRHPVGAAAADDHVVSVAAVEHIASDAPGEPVIMVAPASARVVALASVEYIAAEAADEAIRLRLLQTACHCLVRPRDSPVRHSRSVCRRVRGPSGDRPRATRRAGRATAADQPVIAKTPLHGGLPVRWSGLSLGVAERSNASRWGEGSWSSCCRTKLRCLKY